jgi:hypothetical protein
MRMDSFKVIVDSETRYRCECAPNAFSVWGREYRVVEVLDRWLSPDERYVKLLVSDGGVFILRYVVDEDEWSLVVYSAARIPVPTACAPRVHH